MSVYFYRPIGEPDEKKAARIMAAATAIAALSSSNHLEMDEVPKGEKMPIETSQRMVREMMEAAAEYLLAVADTAEHMPGAALVSFVRLVQPIVEMAQTFHKVTDMITEMLGPMLEELDNEGEDWKKGKQE